MLGKQLQALSSSSLHYGDNARLSQTNTLTCTTAQLSFWFASLRANWIFCHQSGRWCFHCLCCADSKRISPTSESLFSVEASGVRFFWNIYLENIWTDLEHVCLSACRETSQWIIHLSSVDTSEGIAAWRLCTTHTQTQTHTLCLECVLGVFTVVCGCFVLVHVCSTRNYLGKAARARRSSFSHSSDWSHTPHLSA